MALGRKTGGRQKGTPNKVNARREAEIAAAGLTPLDYMLAVLRDPEQPEERRDWAAEKAAPFCHARLSTVDAKLSVNTSIADALDALKRRRASRSC